jgi:hypothetical protein
MNERGDRIEVRELVLVDDEGRRRAVLATQADETSLVFLDASGASELSIGISNLSSNADEASIPCMFIGDRVNPTLSLGVERLERTSGRFSVPFVSMLTRKDGAGFGMRLDARPTQSGVSIVEFGVDGSPVPIPRLAIRAPNNENATILSWDRQGNAVSITDTKK